MSTIIIGRFLREMMIKKCTGEELYFMCFGLEFGDL